MTSSEKMERTEIPNELRLVTVGEMQRIEQESDGAGHSYASMMELAGESVASAIEDEYGIFVENRVLILAGPGNNGGDGLVCARYLHEAGWQVQVYLWKRSTAPENDYEGHFGRLQKLDVEYAHADDDDGFETLRSWLQNATVVVDSLLGTGVDRPIEGQLADLLDVVGEARRHRDSAEEMEEVDADLEDEEDEFGHWTAVPVPAIVAVDAPSGLNCDDGSVDPHTAPADLTVTFAYAKWGHFLFPGAGIVGQLIVADIGIDPALAQDIQTFSIEPSWVGQFLPKRAGNSHKGTFGKALAVVGSVNFPGAAHLSCAAMGRSGAGLVTGAVPQPIWSVVASALTEPTWLVLSHDTGVLNENAANLLNNEVGDYDALLVGCGLSQEEATQDFVEAFFRREQGGHRSVLPTLFRSIAGAEMAGPEKPAGSTPFTSSGHRHQADPASGEPSPLPPTVIDADGLNCLAKLDNWPALLPEQVILTPHPAEMARLCNLEVQEVLEKRWQLARERAAEWNAVVLLKGPYTVIAAPDGRLAVLPVATPALATAGSGDVLAGAVTGLLAQGLAPFEAACLGAWIHGRTGEHCEAEIGPAGTVAGDLISRLPAAMNELRSD